MNEKNRILMVDDSKSIRDALRGMLSADYIIRESSNGEEALEIVTGFKPDLVLLDVEMPKMNGYEVCRRIRADGSLGFVKIIIISTRTELKSRLEGYRVGVDDYLGKPFKEEELLAKVRVFLRLKTVEDQLCELNAGLNDQVRLRTQQLLDAQSMAVIGRHTAGLVHNLNSPLQVILGNSDLLKLQHPDNPRITTLKKAADQMKHIIVTLLNTSSRENSYKPAMIDLNEVIESQIELLKANQFFKHSIQTNLQLEPLPPIRGIYTHFSQSLGNLIKNAAEAMHDSITKRLLVESWAKNTTIHIQVTDTGHGIAERDFENIFKPFFTTKPLTSDGSTPTGTGLGLASCKEMIESYGGRILVESTLGKRTTFQVVLPVNRG
jgi:two-component system, sensor histidine kinase and response regulator